MIIGITGTNGAGKGTAVDYLVKRKGFVHYSARDIWNEEIARRGLPPGRDSMNKVSNDLRAQHGADYFARTAIEKAKVAGGNAVIESIRTPGEAQTIQRNGGVIWAVDADRQLRYERVVLRGSSTDKVSFDEFIEIEDKEMTNSDPNKQNVRGVMDMAERVLINNAAPEELFEQIEDALKEVR